MSIAHKYLCKTLKILHCDISIGNILLYRPDKNKEANGLLVDFDFAKTIKDNESTSDDAGDRTGICLGTDMTISAYYFGIFKIIMHPF